MPLTKKFGLQSFTNAVIAEVPLHVNVGGTRVRVNINLNLGWCWWLFNVLYLWRGVVFLLGRVLVYICIYLRNEYNKDL